MTYTFHYIDELLTALNSGQILKNSRVHLFHKMDSGDAGAQAIATALQSGHCPEGLQVFLNYHKIGSDGAVALAQALQSGRCPPRLQLELTSNIISDEGAFAFAKALQSGHCPQGLQIILRQNKIGNAGIEAIAAALQSGHCPQGLVISVEGNNFNNDCIPVIAHALQSSHCPKGLQINLASNSLNDASIQLIATALQSGHCPDGLQINLGNNSIQTNGAQAIATALQSGHCPEGLVINLANNSIQTNGAQAIATALQSSQCPQGLQVNLGWNNIDTEGIQAIAQALQSGQCPPGLKIILNGNKINHTDIQAIATALQSGQCPQYLQIHLNSNNISPDCAAALAQALQSGQCPQGLQLHLEWNNIGEVGAIRIAQALQSGHCPQGLQIYLDYNNIDIDGIGTETIASVILSGKYPLGLRLHGIHGFHHHFKTALTALLPPDEILQGPTASHSEENDSEVHDWLHTFNIIRNIFCFDATAILADVQLKRTIQAAIEYYIRSLQHGIAGVVNEEDYHESYFPVLQIIADLILAMYEVSQSASDEQKQWISTLMLTLADSILPEHRDNWSDNMYLWARAQKLILIEKAFSLYPDNPTVFARHWQSFCDTFNKVPPEQQIFEQDCNLNSIKENENHTDAVDFYYQNRLNGLFKLPENTAQESSANSANTDFFKVRPELFNEKSTTTKKYEIGSCSSHGRRRSN